MIVDVTDAAWARRGRVRREMARVDGRSILIL